MSNDKWNRWGDDMNDLVQKAIDSGNYKSLKKDFTASIEKAVKDFVDIGTRVSKNPPIRVNLNGNSVEINDGYKDRIRRPNPTGTVHYSHREIKIANQKNANLYISNVRLWISGFLKTFFGGLTGLGCLLALLDRSDPTGPPPLLLAALSISFTYMFYRGLSTLINRRKFKKYRTVLSVTETGDYASIADLAVGTGESVAKTKKRIKMMIQKNWFRQGYLDRLETTLMTSNAAYRLYKASEQGREAVKAEEVKKEAEHPKKDGSTLPKEVQEVLENGRRYLNELRKLNDVIVGEEVSEKISKIEELTDRILKRVESHPNSVDETKQLMKYYLPMTIKLLKAYADMDLQPKYGQNIEKSKKEIEGVLDELNLAFEKLLDDLYKDTAWDVASDISVLNAMLKRQGLKGNDFGNLKVEEEQMSEETDKEIKLRL